MRRVVVTGIGLVTPLGIGTSASWRRLLAGNSGLGSLRGRVCQVTKEPFDGLPSLVAGCVDSEEWGKVKGTVRMPANVPRFVEFAVIAANEALSDAKWTSEQVQNSGIGGNGDITAKVNAHHARTGVIIGSGIGSLEDMYNTSTAMWRASNEARISSHRSRGVAALDSDSELESESISSRGQGKGTSSAWKRVSPHFVPRILCGMAAGHVSIQFGLQGPISSPSTACATGAHAIAEAFHTIVRGDADVMVVGGTEACISPMGIAGFARARALSTHFNDKPHESSRPFDSKRDGFVVGEGCGILVLEDLEHAVLRGAPIYAEVVGAGLAADAFHITAPTTDGSGAYRAMRAALESASRHVGLSVDDIVAQIGYLNAHATSTLLGDVAEMKAIQRIFQGESETRRAQISVSSTKGAIGHLLGAAGSVEAAFTILALQQGVVPPTLNLQDAIPDAQGLDMVIGTGQSKEGLEFAVSNSFGFGGFNTSLLFRRYRPPGESHGSGEGLN